MFVSTHMRKCVIAAAFGFFVFNTSAAKAASAEFLEQNWSKSTRQSFYTSSQGSQIMPHKWFKALERADSSDGFFSDGLRRHGYIPNRRSLHNPDGLPVGFVVDRHLTGWWIGMTCAACHTNQIVYDGTTMQIDGAPAQADMYGLLVDIRDSIQATIKDRNGPKFIRFARKVLRLRYSNRRADKLYGQVKHFSGDWAQYVIDSTPETPWGRARLDAFGMIFNRVSNIDLGVPANNAAPDAPVSYPFLWGASWENKVQWNGIAPNKNDFERLGRNVGEVLGVFGKVDLRKPRGLERGYKNTARRVNLLELEHHLKNLWSPKWPQGILGKIKQPKAEQGKALFARHCVSCHVVVPHGKQKTKIDVTMTPISKIRTDPKMASNACNRMADTAQLEGVRMPPIIGKKLPKKAKVAALLQNVVVGSILALPSSRVSSAFNSAAKKLDSDEAFRSIKNIAEELALDGEKLLEDEADKLNSVLHAMAQESSAPSDCGPDDPLMAYKARPLDGIWATGPYMHNGSVANLYEVLLPAEDRMKEFYVGSRNFDPKHVGFENKKGPDTFLFDTSKPGNSNAGHIYGNNRFTEEEREQLVEYMKSL